MNKPLLFFCLSSFCLRPVLQAQTPDTVVITAKADTSIHSIVCGANDAVIYRPLILDHAEYNFTKIVDGKAPGLQTTNGGGQPGASAEMLVRGMSSISDNNAPFIVLDGIPFYGDPAAINTNDISNITILKDAGATFDFGNRGGNGVINIVTKKKFGYNGYKNKLEVNAQFGVNTQALPDYNTLAPKEFYETMYIAMQNSGMQGNVVDFLGGYNAYHLNGVGDSLQNDYLIDPATGKLNTAAQLKYQDNWRKEMRRMGIRQNYNVASSARNEKGGYYLSAGYLNDKGYAQQTGFTRYSARFNGDYKPLKWLTLGLRAQGVIGDQDNTNGALFSTTQLMAPVYPVYYRNANDEQENDPLTGMDKYDWGSLTSAPNSSIGTRRTYADFNSIALQYLDKHSERSSMFILNPYLEVSFLEDFTYTANFNYSYNKSDFLDAYNADYGSLASMNGAEGKTANSSDMLNFIHKLVWDKEVKQHHFTLTAGHEYFGQKESFLSTFQYLNSTSIATSASFKNSMNNKGYFSKVAYDYKEKYLLFAGFRRDATLFTESHWVNNWAAGAAYVISKESFMRDVNWIEQLKLKASYGTQGRYFPSYSQENMPFLYAPPPMGGYTEKVVPEPGNQLNIGLESDLFRNRFSFELNVYNRNSGENVLYLNLWPASADGRFRYNNKGLELNIYATNIKSRNFFWSTHFMLTHNKNTISAMPTGRDSIITQSNRLYKKGNSMAGFYMVEYAGVNPDNGDALYYAKDGNGKEVKTADYDYALITNRKNMGSAFPFAYGSLTNFFKYKNIDFSFQVNYSLGGKYYDRTYQDLMGNGNNANNWSTDILNYWTPENRNTDVPRLNMNDVWVSSGMASSRFLKSASYLNIANVYVGYTFNETKIKKAKMKSLRVYLTASNLLMFTAAKGMNPQGSFYGTPGYAYLPSRTVMFGLNVGI